MSADQLSKLKSQYAQTFLSPQGETVLKDLREAYSGSPMVKGDPHATAYNVGAQDVIRYIETMIQENA